jgi:hypothetical protein
MCGGLFLYKGLPATGERCYPTDMQGLQRFPRDRSPQRAGELFRVPRAPGSCEPAVWCDLWSHPLGWEIRLFAAGHLKQSHVCLTQEEVLTTMEAWKRQHIDRPR